MVRGAWSAVAWAPMRELQTGVWHWEALHPDWQDSEPWDQMVSSYAIDDGSRLLLFDPLAPPVEIVELAARRETAIVLTCPWHERDTQSLVERLGVPVFTPRPDSAQYLMDTYGITAEQAGDGSPDLVWLFKDGQGEARPYVAGDRLPVGVDAFPGQKPSDMVLWVENHNAVVAGDTLVDFRNGLEINARWLRLQGVTREEVVAGLRPLLALQVEHVLATHGGPFDRAALERALAPEPETSPRQSAVDVGARSADVL
jgi:glyoxylase-like metal-dependent hydrolase (beta-lactamase superfamily II)